MDNQVGILGNKKQTSKIEELLKQAGKDGTIDGIVKKRKEKTEKPAEKQEEIPAPTAPAKPAAGSLDKFIEVDKIDRPGEYRFATDGNWDGNFTYHDHGEIASNEIYGEKPDVLYDVIPNLLKKKFPNLVLKSFVESRFGGSIITEKNWDCPSFLDDYLVCGRETYFIKSEGTYSNASGSWTFEIRDVANLKVVDGEVVEGKPKKRDGSFEMMISGDAPHSWRKPPKHWRGWIDYEGERPGKLIRTVIDYINAEKKRMNIPLWWKPK